MTKPPKRVRFSELSAEQKRVFSRPSEFGRRVLKIPLTNEQAAACDSFMPHRANVSVLCCNEAGKTTKILPTVILWHVCVFPRRGENGGVTATSGSWAQVEKQLMPALHAQSPKFPRWRFLDTEIQRDGSPNFMAYAVTNPGLAEGFHGSEETPLMMLFDEAKSVRDSIIEAGEKRCRPQRLGLLSSPGYSQGKFYASHTSEAKYWTRHKITYESCPWIDRVEMRRVVEKAGGGDYERGLQDPLIRSAYFAEFMAFVKDALLALADIEECIAAPPQGRPGKRHAFCDFAGGGDENAIGIRIGNRVWLQDSWRDDNEMAAVGRFVKNFVLMRDKWGFRADEIEGDADGMGSPMVSRLHELGWEIIPFHGNSAPMDPRYYNRIAELWYDGAKAIKERKIIIPDDEDLKAQMLDRIGKLHSDGLIQLESKKELFARQAREQRQKRSPDRADAIFGAMGDLPIIESVNIGGPQQERGPWHDDPDMGPDTVEREGSIPEEVLRGFDAGG
jgi:hypothetical protein